VFLLHPKRAEAPKLPISNADSRVLLLDATPLEKIYSNQPLEEKTDKKEERKYQVEEEEKHQISLMEEEELQMISKTNPEEEVLQHNMELEKETTKKQLSKRHKIIRFLKHLKSKIKIKFMNFNRVVGVKCLCLKM
jgi:hypothetical protein